METVNVKLTVKELNEIFYCLGHILDSDESTMVCRELAKQLRDKIWDDLVKEYIKEQNSHSLSRTFTV